MPAWQLWWLCGPPLIGALAGLSAFSDNRWLAGAPAAAAFAEVLRLVVYWAWCRLAWRSVTEPRSSWTPLAQAALVAGLITVALT